MPATPSIELIQGPAAADGRRDEHRRSQRLRVFLITFALLFVIGQIGNFARPAEYRASATLLTVEPQGIDRRSADADVEHVTIQSRLLLGEELLRRVRAALQSDGFSDLPDPVELEAMLEVKAVPETNLVELRASGDQPAILTASVNHWADAYVERRAERVSEATDRTTRELRGQQFALEDKIEAKRGEIERFQQAHDIVGPERGENQVLARQQGLNDSLNKALEQQAEAQARLNSLHEAVRQGRALVPQEESRTLAAMEQELQKLQGLWAALNQKYTPTYLERDPAYKAIPGEIDKLQAKVNDIKSTGKRNILNQATQEYEAATETVETLQRQLIAHKRQAAEFSARLARYESLKEELASLQELSEENQQRLATIEIKNRQEFPPMQIVDYAVLPRNPIYPHYWRDAGLVFAVSVAMGLFMAWLIDYLSERNRSDQAPLTTTGVRVYANEPPTAIGNQAAGGPELELKSPPAQLQQSLARELEPAELQALLSAAPDDARAAMGLLLSGVAPAELEALGVADYDPAEGTLQLNGGGGRQLQLPPAVCRWLAEGDALARLVGHTGEEIRAAVTVAAVDAGIADPSSVTPEALRHSYLLHLIRQGARLGELAQRVGPVPAVQLQKYGRYSPPGSNRPLSQIETVHPALAV